VGTTARKGVFEFAIINHMEVGDIRFYKERWKAVEEIERQELRAMSLEEHWRQINWLWGMGMALGFSFEPDESELEVYKRWAKIKALYEAGVKPSAFQPPKA
jgi:hypothetical protein